MTSFILNGKTTTVDAEPDTPVLWVLRDHLNKTGTKFGCGAGLCGACTVLIDGQPMRSCVYPLAAVEGKQVDTIESLGGNHALQRAWVENNVPQCGYCQSGQIMSSVALLNSNPNPTDEEIQTALAGNICRCGTYHRILKAVKQVVAESSNANVKASGRVNGNGNYYDATAVVPGRNS